MCSGNRVTGPRNKPNADWRTHFGLWRIRGCTFVVTIADELVSARRLNMGGRSFVGAKQFDVGTRARLQTTYVPGGAL